MSRWAQAFAERYAKDKRDEWDKSPALRGGETPFCPFCPFCPWHIRKKRTLQMSRRRGTLNAAPRWPSPPALAADPAEIGLHGEELP